jgi:hypothetical protein
MRKSAAIFHGCLWLTAGCTADKAATSPDSGTSVDPRWIAVGAGEMMTCGLDDAGSATCWGREDFIGEVPEFRGAIGLDVNSHTACAWDAAGALWCWGSGVSEEFDIEFVTDPVLDLSTGGSFCVLTVEFDVVCPGVDGGRVERFLQEVGAGWRALPHGMGADAHCFIDSAGELYCFDDTTVWGERIVTPDGPFEMVACTFSECCALDTGGGLTCGLWDPFWTDEVTQFVEYDDGPWADIEGDQGLVCVSEPTRQSACWASWDAGSSLDAVLETPSTPFVQIAAGKYHACGLDAAGDITCWGDDRAGETTPPE